MWNGVKFLCKRDGITVGTTAGPAQRSDPRGGALLRVVLEIRPAGEQ
jgi:hypothetical protein